MLYEFSDETFNLNVSSLNFLCFFDFFLCISCVAFDSDCLFIVEENFYKQAEPVDLEPVKNDKVEAIKRVEKAKLFRNAADLVRHIAWVESEDQKGKAEEFEVEPDANQHN